MLVQTTNLLQRVRVITIALVTIIGFGTMAMKPAAAPHNFTYGVAETAGGLNWQIRSDATGQIKGLDYICEGEANRTCIIFSNATLNPGDLVPKDPALIASPGRFERP
ncbi:hypothetical protein [Pedobacter hartonius]|uniref:Uncharacterized protein n=1 Tax=Pedobacter hartonius TaxID=425514 RepID=A0A1H4G5R9_9SPHI|nr:hypothetical protein [Pedobacter hartonius]SEB04966.1 hypothetical protein SAMN05443550_10958 [Pedobacter hartonius]